MRNKKQTGIFHYNKNGFGYISYEEDGVRGVIPLMPTSRDCVFDGDTVEVAVACGDDSRERRFGGKIMRVISRKQDYVVGTLFADGDGREYIKPNSYIPFRIPVKREYCGNFPVGDLVKATVFSAKSVSAFRTRPEHSYGPADTYESATALLFDGSCFGESFSPDAALQARELMRVGWSDALEGRRTFDAGLFCPVRGRDGRGDIAFGVDATDVSTTVYIHIVDVDSLITVGSPLDVDASHRFRAIRARSASKFSLLPMTLLGSVFNVASHGTRPAVTLRVEFNNDGKITSFDAFESYVSNVTPISVDIIHNLSKGERVYVQFKKELQVCRDLAQKLAKNRVEAGGVAVLPVFVGYFEGQDSNDALDTDFLGYNIFDELLVAAGGALGKYYIANGATGLYETAQEAVLAPEADVPLYLKPLSYFCDIYSDGYLASAAAATRGTAYYEAVSACINFASPCPSYSTAPLPHKLLGLSCYAPIMEPTSSYASLVQLRALKALIHNEPVEIPDIDEFSARNEAAVIFERDMRLLSALWYYSKTTLVPVTVVATDGSTVTVRTASGVLGELVMGTGVSQQFAVGTRLKARVKSVSFDHKQIAFTL